MNQGNVRMCGVHFKLALENQDSVNLTYPWRLMELDCLAYGKGIEEVQEQNVLKGAKYGEEDDFKYCYKKENRIEPILNLTLYRGKEKWKEPLTLRGVASGPAPALFREINPIPYQKSIYSPKLPVRIAPAEASSCQQLFQRIPVEEPLRRW